MAATQVSERRARAFEALIFWVVTLVICGVAGFGSYRYGRQWIGDRLGDDVKSVLTSEQLASRVTPEALDRAASGSDNEIPDEPPKEAVVEVRSTAVGPDDRANLGAEKTEGQTRQAPDPSEDEEKTEERNGEPDEDGAASEETSSDARTPATPSVPAEDSGGRRYVVRAGSFAKSANAERLVQDLRAKGYQPFVTSVVKDGVEYTRVNVATYDEQESALKLRGELRGDGYTDASVSTE